MPLCNKCGELISRNFLRHQTSMKCKLGEEKLKSKKLEEELECMKAQLNREDKYKERMKKYRTKYRDIKKLYDQLMEKGVGNTYINNDSSSKTVNNTLLNLPGFSENLLESTMDTLQNLPFHNQKKTSHQVAKMIANHAKQDNGKQNLYCADPNRLKFIFYNGDEWFEDMNREKTVRDVCKCILEKIGDPDETIDLLGKQKKDELLADETNGYSGPLDLMLQKKVLDYQQDVSKTIRQIEACADDENEENDNDFAKDYLKKLASLVRGDAEDRNEARKLVK